MATSATPEEVQEVFPRCRLIGRQTGGFRLAGPKSLRVTGTGAADEFLSRPKWDRFRILLAGPVMNIVLSLVLMTVVGSGGRSGNPSI